MNGSYRIPYKITVSERQITHRKEVADSLISKYKRSLLTLSELTEFLVEVQGGGFDIDSLEE